ncbi:hypothetical protein BDZ91DRAFT_747554 [Kalaharituber pfeilii]|nr:hypothetical protein BDZ91DRAFT_747554 [Kalaharituber pfeilii]
MKISVELGQAAANIIRLQDTSAILLHLLNGLDNAATYCSLYNKVSELANALGQLKKLVAVEEYSGSAMEKLLLPMKQLQGVLDMLVMDLECQAPATNSSVDGHIQDLEVEDAESARGYLEGFKELILTYISSSQSEISKIGIETPSELSGDEEEEASIESTQVELEVPDKLSNLNDLDNHSALLRNRCNDTESSILKNPIIIDWLNGDEHCLSVEGSAGSGKSFLVAVINEQLVKMLGGNLKNAGHAYAYCSYQQQDQTALHLLVNLVHQLVGKRPKEFEESIPALFQGQQHTNASPGFPEYVTLLELVTSLYSRVFIVVDGLHEWPENETSRFLQICRGILETGKLSLLVTSRGGIRDISDIDAVRLTITNDVIQSHTVSQLETVARRATEDSREYVKPSKDTTIKFHGNFLITQFYELLMNSMSKYGNISKYLQSYPQDLNQCYHLVLDCIEACDSGQLVKEALVLIASSETPWTRGELSRALSAKVKRLSTHTEELLVSESFGLISVEHPRGFVRLSHYTTREFVLSNSSGRFSDVHATIAKSCMRHLKEWKCNSLVDPRSTNNAISGSELCDDILRSYATRHWSVHLREALHDEELYSQVFPFLKQCSPPFGAVCLNNPGGEFGTEKNLYVRTEKHHQNKFQEVIAAASHGLSTILEDQIDQYALKPEEIGSKIVNLQGQTLLSIAAENGHVSLVKWLLCQRCIQPNLPCKYGRTALSFAAQKGHLQVVEELLRRSDINPNIVDLHGKTALYYAVQQGHVAIVHLLLNRNDVDLNLQETTDQRTVLIQAVKDRHLPLVKMLLQRDDVNPNLGARYGEVPLLLAVANNDMAIVKHLLARADVDVNIRNEDGRTALSIAIKRGYNKQTELLLSREDVDLSYA